MYGLNLNVATMEPALRYQAIQSGDIQITDAYSTDAELARYDLQVLEDDKQLFPPYQGAPLMKEALLKMCIRDRFKMECHINATLG